MKRKLVAAKTAEEQIPIFLRQLPHGVELNVSYNGHWTIGTLVLDSDGKIVFIRKAFDEPLTDVVATEKVAGAVYLKVFTN